MTKNKKNRFQLPLLFALWVIHGIIALWAHHPHGILSIQKNYTSGSHLFVTVLLFSWIIICSALIYTLINNNNRGQTWNNALKRSNIGDWILITSFIGISGLLFLWGIYGLSASTPESMIDNYLRIFKPLLNLATFVFCELIIFILINDRIHKIHIDLKLIQRSGAVFLVLLLLSYIVTTTKMGILPSHQGDWSRGLPAVPLFEWHIVLASLFLLLTVFLDLNKKILSFVYLDVLICISIWGITSLIWATQPVNPNASALAPHEPNFEIYPFIDSQTYDQLAQSALVGTGFGKNIPPRSLYITFLTLIHTVAGQRYESMIMIQSLVFAIFPVFLYIFGRQFFGRPVGIATASLSLFRDFTSNLVSPLAGNLSYSKIFMSEIPTAILLVLLLILGSQWIKEEFPTFKGFLIGGVLGLAMLIRTQAIVALPVIILFGLLTHKWNIKRLLYSGLAIFFSLSLVVSPWLFRNWELTGRVIFDSPEYQISNLALRYSWLNGLTPNIVQTPGETYVEYNERLKDISRNAITLNPKLALWGVANTFLNHGVNNILLMPLRYELVSMKDFWVPEDAFWEKWSDSPSRIQSLYLVFFIFLFGLGVSVVWHRNGWLGLLPLGLNLAYNFWTSLALLSGQRFMVSMDWSIYFYYAAGIFSIMGGLLMALSRGRPLVLSWLKENFPMDLTPAPQKNVGMGAYFPIGLLFLILGAMPVMVERIYPEKYPVLPDAQVLSNLIESPSLKESNLQSCLIGLDEKKMLTYIQGRSLYPRYYDAGDGESFTDAAGYKSVDESRIVFEFVGQMNDRVILPLSENPVFFPHAADVTLMYGTDDKLWFVHIKQGIRDGFYVSNHFDYSACD